MHLQGQVQADTGSFWWVYTELVQLSGTPPNKSRAIDAKKPRGSPPRWAAVDVSV
jgi:hypothetical protein